MPADTLDKISADMKEAMKSKNRERLNAIRLIRSALKNAEIDKGSLSDEDIINILSTEAKKRRESAEMYRNGDRNDLADKEDFELSVIQEYLPEQLSDDDVRIIIDELIAKTGASSKSDIGKIMGPMMGKIKGKFDGARAKDLVMEKLS